MRASERVLKGLNTLVSVAAALVLLGVGAYCAYALWDNGQVYAAVDSVQELSLIHISEPTRPY